MGRKGTSTLGRVAEQGHPPLGQKGTSTIRRESGCPSEWEQVSDTGTDGSHTLLPCRRTHGFATQTARLFRRFAGRLGDAERNRRRSGTRQTWAGAGPGFRSVNPPLRRTSHGPRRLRARGKRRLAEGEPARCLSGVGAWALLADAVPAQLPTRVSVAGTRLGEWILRAVGAAGPLHGLAGSHARLRQRACAGLAVAIRRSVRRVGAGRVLCCPDSPAAVDLG